MPPLVVFFLARFSLFKRDLADLLLLLFASFSLAVVRGAVLRFLRKGAEFSSPPKRRGDSEWIIDFPPYASPLDKLAVEFSFAFLFSDNAGLPHHSNVRVEHSVRAETGIQVTFTNFRRKLFNATLN